MRPTACEILNMTSPFQLFSFDLETTKKEYLGLAKTWHPDLHNASKEANTVMTKINELYIQCINSAKHGKWEKPGLIRLRGKDGKTYEIKYRFIHHFELGTLYISSTVLLYLINAEHKDLFDNGRKMINSLSFADGRMKSEMQRCLPKIIAEFETLDNQSALVLEKVPDLLSLRDVLSYYGGKLPPRHAAWILSCLYNIACYLDYASSSHNSITLDTFFISPSQHTGALLGGWWYSVPQQSRMLGVPEKIYSIMPPDIKDKKLGNILTDLEGIRLIGRELLGSAVGTKLTDDVDIPTPFVHWVRGTSCCSAFKEYSNWSNVLLESFGPREFIAMDLTEDRLYDKSIYS